jgi:4-aminobutyrate aminotransferase
MHAPEIKTPLPGPKAKAIIERDKQFVSPSYTRDYPFVIARGEGAVVEDVDGNRFLDCAAGIAVNSTGVSHPEVVKAIAEQAQKFIHMSGTDFYYEPQVRLAEELASIVPIEGAVRSFFGNSGTEATEASIKLARYSTRRQGIIAFLGAFHGRSLGSLSLTASKAVQRRGFGPFMPGVFHAPYPDPYRFNGSADACAAQALSFIRDQIFVHLAAPDEIAAIVVEPIQGEGGYVVPPVAFLQGLREIAREHGIVLIVDEVQSGMGRTGKMFASEHFGLKADAVNIAKGIASGLPLGVTCARADIMAWPPGAHASTFGGNPVACAAACAVVETVTDELLADVRAKGTRLVRKLERLPATVEVRGAGLLLGLEIDRVASDAIAECLDQGMLVGSAGERVLRLTPPLTITDDELSRALTILEEVLR